jgi:regulator of sigma E protease
MELLSLIYLNIVPFIVLLSFLVFFHELGHYLVARFNGVKIEVFSIGFGKEIFGWTDKAGTRWKVSILPLGGYVKMFSDLDAASKPDQEKIKKMTAKEKDLSHFHKSVWQRIQISAAGPLANYLLAIVILGTLFATVGQQEPSKEARIGIIAQDGAADKAGLKTGDQVLSIDGIQTPTFMSLHETVRDSAGRSLKIKVKRQDQVFTLSVIPETIKIRGRDIGRLGVMQAVDYIQRNPLTTWWYATAYTLHVTGVTLKALGQMVIGQRESNSISGPLGIAKMTAEIAQTNFINLLWFAAFLSINLGLINLFPIPMLDGGHLLYYFIEAIRGKPLSVKSQEIGFRIGLVLVTGLMLFGTWNDINRFAWFKNLFR